MEGVTEERPIPSSSSTSGTAFIPSKPTTSLISLDGLAGDSDTWVFGQDDGINASSGVEHLWIS